MKNALYWIMIVSLLYSAFIWLPTIAGDCCPCNKETQIDLGNYSDIIFLSNDSQDAVVVNSSQIATGSWWNSSWTRRKTL